MASSGGSGMGLARCPESELKVIKRWNTRHQDPTRIEVDREKLQQYVRCTLTLRNESPEYSTGMYIKKVTNKDIEEELTYLQGSGC